MKRQARDIYRYLDGLYNAEGKTKDKWERKSCKK